MVDKPYSEMTYRETVAESGNKVRLTLTEPEAVWLRSYLNREYPDHRETNEGIARAGTRTCNGLDLCWISGPLSRKYPRLRGHGRSAARKILLVAQRLIRLDKGPDFRII